VNNIIVKRYSDPVAVGGWQGWIEPEDRTWIAFIDMEGRPTFFLNRDPVTGAVSGPTVEGRSVPSPEGQ